MLHEFLASNIQIIISRCREKVAKRFDSHQIAASVDHGVPLFLQQLVATLQLERTKQRPSGGHSEQTTAQTDIARAAALHGADLLRRGFSVEEVVQDYGNLCQCATALAVEMQVTISTDDFRILNRCLDNAIAGAVGAYGSARQASLELAAATLRQQFAVEHRRLVDTAIQAFDVIKTGKVGIGGATAILLGHALEQLRSLTDGSVPPIPSASASDKASAGERQYGGDDPSLEQL